MEGDLVDAVAVAVVGSQLRRVLVRLDAHSQDVGPAADRAELARPLLGPFAALAPQGLGEHGVRLERVVALEGRSLVRHLVGGARDLRAMRLDRGHRAQG